jgi:pimeloyl-ACP methyl ester carboxylesterase
MELPAVDGVTHRTVRARGLDFHIAEAGAGDPIVLLHGWPQHWLAWRRVVPLVAPHARLVMPDLRGFGWSDAPPDGYDKANMARDVLALLDALGLERVRLAGHDWGGWIAFLACMEAPERFERLLALGISPPFGKPSPRALLDLWRFAYMLAIAAPAVGERLVGSERFARAMLTARPGAFTDDDLRAFAGVLAEPARARASVQLYRTFVLREMAGGVRGRLQVPARLVVGERDLVVRPSLLAGRERYADDLTIELVPSCGHWIPAERPDLVVERLLLPDQP